MREEEWIQKDFVRCTLLRKSDNIIFKGLDMNSEWFVKKWSRRKPRGYSIILYKKKIVNKKRGKCKCDLYYIAA